jgi:glucosamine-6-phosphate deaminase
MSVATTHLTGADRVPGTRIACHVFDSHGELARHVAGVVAGVIRERNALGQDAVLGLPAGTTPLGVYRELIRLHQEGQVDFSRVVVFQLDEYYGLGHSQSRSRYRWIHEHLLEHVNIPEQNIHRLDGTVEPADVEAHCREYETLIDHAGGIDVLLAGIGPNGHVAANEPFSVRHSRTRLCTLDPVTRKKAASDFFGEENVPVQALTMGLGTILGARKIVLIAMGEHKAAVIRDAVEGPVADRVPASFLQDHSDAVVLLDPSAAKELTARAMPWVMGNVAWSELLIKRAVLWLCQQTGKALLKLDDDDFRRYNLHQLLRHHGPAEQLAQRVFQWMMETIEYHPAGTEPQRVICFSPHPDDDVISMGGTLIRLVQDGHEVHIAYMTSGNVAVFDHDALRVADMVAEYNRLFEIDREKSKKLESDVRRALAGKRPGEEDIDCVRLIKGMIRWSEAKAGALQVGCREDCLHFLDLPFYRTGLTVRKPATDEDRAIIRSLIDRVDPQQIYVAGDLSDPHGTHRVCAEAIFDVLDEMEREKGSRPEVLLYRGAWQEYELHEIELAVPLSPGELERKRQAIFMHESQKDEALFPGPDPREFWQRAEDRNKGTAEKYNQLGLPEYYALEAFVRYRGTPI